MFIVRMFLPNCSFPSGNAVLFILCRLSQSFSDPFHFSRFSGTLLKHARIVGLLIKLQAHKGEWNPLQALIFLLSSVLHSIYTCAHTPFRVLSRIPNMLFNLYISLAGVWCRLSRAAVCQSETNGANILFPLKESQCQRIQFVSPKKGNGFRFPLLFYCLFVCASRIQLFVTLQTVACQAPLFMGFSINVSEVNFRHFNF